MLWQVASKEHTRWPPTNYADPATAQAVSLLVPEPTPRSGHSVVFLPDGRLLFFGGHDGFKPLSDVFMHTPSDGTWSEVLLGPENPQLAAAQAVGEVWPPPLCFHSATFIGEEGLSWRIVVYGGRGMVDLQGAVYELTLTLPDAAQEEIARTTSEQSAKDAKQNRYKVAKDKKEGPKKLYTRLAPRVEWREIDFVSASSPHFHHPGKRPPDRMMHTATLLRESKNILVLGGYGRGATALGDLWELSCSAWSWKQIRIRNWGPAAGHSTALIQDGMLLVFGGFRAPNTPADTALWHIPFKHAADVPIIDALPAHIEAPAPASPSAVAPAQDGGTSTESAPTGRFLHSFTELSLTQTVDTVGDQQAHRHLRPPVTHPTLESRYFFGKDQHLRDGWSRELERELLSTMHWSQQYDRSRRFVLYGGFGVEDQGLTDVWELRIFPEATTRVVAWEGETVSLPPGSVGSIVEAYYGERTSTIDVTHFVAEAVDDEGGIRGLVVANEAFNIMPRNDSQPERRWRDNVEQWVNGVGDQDPYPGIRKKLVIKFAPPPGSPCKYMWVQVPLLAVRQGPALQPAAAAPLGDTAPSGSLPDLRPDADDETRRYVSDAAASLRQEAELRRMRGEGGGANLGIPPGRGGHVAVHVERTLLGVGGLLVMGGACGYSAKPPFPDSVVRGHSVSLDAANAFALLLVICPHCANPMVQQPRRYCVEKTCAECVLYCPTVCPDW